MGELSVQRSLNIGIELKSFSLSLNVYEKSYVKFLRQLTIKCYILEAEEIKEIRPGNLSHLISVIYPHLSFCK